jgi:hypothetical protein
MVSSSKSGMGWQRVRVALLALAGFAILTLVVSLVKEPSIDWQGAFYLAAQEVLHGRSPYNVINFLNVPWTLIPLLPLALLPVRIGSAAIFVLSLAIFIYVAYRLGARGIWIVIFLMAPPVIHSLYLGNIDALSLLGFVLPPQIGLFFVLIKPQIGLVMAIFWFGEAWRQGGVRSVVRVFAPVTLAALISVAIFGNWMTAERLDLQVYSTWNASWWPMGIPVGLVLCALSLRDRRRDYAMAASPFLAPYVTHSSWMGVVAALLPRKMELALAVIGMWIVALLRFLAMSH